ncbi:MAG: riboflavin synthase [Chloroflexota bacterium]|nr:riboflavin synthase [Chloroflexota bacterium]MDE2970249.1 riboflavin synthase [Chloroflexota bacterium]
MFTGIVAEKGKVLEAGAETLVIESWLALEGAAVGDSIAVNGACLTITTMAEGRFAVDVTPETLRRTNLGDLREGSAVNLEPSLAYGGKVGGHLVQGHVDAVGVVAGVTPEGNSRLITFDAPREIMRYVVEKGFVAVDGISLTVAGLSDAHFTVAVIPYTDEHTTLGERGPGDRVNLEADILAKYTERLLTEGETQAAAG